MPRYPKGRVSEEEEEEGEDEPEAPALPAGGDDAVADIVGDLDADLHAER